ncbi:MAG: hypothetical protein LQ340_007053 [Diploschistes diacapsis]|nr:MAG: hypothetical protein LQ340_007053 [Diploschistes diacapsis]
MHGSRCSCALKKEHLEAVPENPLPVRARSRAHTDTRKPRLSTTCSDPSITQFANGHHKPVHRLNHAGHDCAPYKIPRPHSIHGSSSLVQRPLDDLPLDNSSNGQSLFPDYLSSLQQDNQRLVRSAQGSPGLNPLVKFDHFNQLPPLDPSYPAYNTSLASSPATDDCNQTYQNFDSYTSPQEDQPPLCTPLSGPSYVWTALDLPLGRGDFAAASSQPPSYASLDQSHLSRPDLTTASSADVSEVGDFAAQGVPSPGFADGSPFIPSPAKNIITNGYNLSTESFHVPNPSGGLGTNFDTSSIESFVPQANASPFDPTDLSIKPDPDAFTRHGLTVQDVQKMAHPGLDSTGIDIAPAAAPMAAVPTSDPLWAATYTGAEDEAGFVPSSRPYRDQNWIS